MLCHVMVSYSRDFTYLLTYLLTAVLMFTAQSTSNRGSAGKQIICCTAIIYLTK